MSEEVRLRMSGWVNGGVQAAADQSRRAARHRAPVVEATARGTGLLGSCSRVGLMVTA
jgi:hypothetical protein